MVKNNLAAQLLARIRDRSAMVRVKAPKARVAKA